MKSPQLVYYLDDDIDDLYFFKEITEKLGHKVSLFVNGNIMLRELRRKGPKPDIIFLDIHMPVVDGEEILHVIKKTEHWKDIPVVMISNAYPKKMVQYFLDAGANYLMKKPQFHEMEPALDRVFKTDWNTFQAYG